MYSVAEYLLQAKAQGNSFTIRREFTIKGENGQMPGGWLAISATGSFVKELTSKPDCQR